MCVEKRLVPSLFDGVDMDPALAVFAVNLGPDVVLAVPNPTDSATNCTTQHAEAVGPFTYTSSPCLEQDEGVAVARESLMSLALGVGALVEFDTVGATGMLIGKRGDHAYSDGRSVACTAFGVVNPLEEVALEPLHQSPDYTVLIAPGGLCVGS